MFGFEVNQDAENNVNFEYGFVIESQSVATLKTFANEKWWMLMSNRVWLSWSFESFAQYRSCLERRIISEWNCVVESINCGIQPHHWRQPCRQWYVNIAQCAVIWCNVNNLAAGIVLQISELEIEDAVWMTKHANSAHINVSQLDALCPLSGTLELSYWEELTSWRFVAGCKHACTWKITHASWMKCWSATVFRSNSKRPMKE